MFDICLQVDISPDENSSAPVKKDLYPLSCVLPASPFCILLSLQEQHGEQGKNRRQSYVPGKCFAECEA